MADRLELVKNDENEQPPQYAQIQQGQPGVPYDQYGQPMQYAQQPAGVPYAQQPAGMPYGQQQPPAQFAQPAPMQYNQYGQPGNAVVLTQPTQTVIVTAPPRPPSYMWLSCVVYWCCCNPLAGTIAFALSLVSQHAADENRTDEARNFGKAALWVSIAGIFIGIACAIGIVIWWVKVVNAAEDDINNTFQEVLDSFTTTSNPWN